MGENTYSFLSSLVIMIGFGITNKLSEVTGKRSSDLSSDLYHSRALFHREHEGR